MRELDVILDRFLDRGYDALSTDGRLAFAALLERQDTDLYAWLTGKSASAEPALQAVIERILELNERQ
ncbi:MAG: succinate dehydrogenase assembly factor 2 [Gammaproteobacteria bacterium]|nr:succinate dehydrogenase assembly factor 2 [Gammaproteobacteria bacterium]NNM00318.1 succinate dehydrogenase assembly factor 2 [Gammaproteobacteria bacterium]